MGVISRLKRNIDLAVNPLLSDSERDQVDKDETTDNLEWAYSRGKSKKKKIYNETQTGEKIYTKPEAPLFDPKRKTNNEAGYKIKVNSISGLGR